MPYTHLSTKEISQTLSKIHARIIERFPESGLSKLAAELAEVARDAQDRSRWVSRPNYALRIIIGAFMAVVVLITFSAVWGLELETKASTLSDFVLMLNAATNDMILLGGALFLLFTLERRLKRLKVLRILHKLRALAHAIDMLQLTKDPTKLLPNNRATSSSPKNSLDSYQLARYLDYCSELLSIISKIAAVYAQHFDDQTVLITVGEIETLTSNLGQKIWSKITVLQLAKS